MSNQHSEWLNLVPHSGPFVAEPVLNHAFPQGLEKLDPIKKKIIRQAYDEWRDAIETEDKELEQLHKAWIDYVMQLALELDKDILKSGENIPDSLKVELPEHGITLKPDYVVIDDQHADTPLLLIQVYDHSVKLDETVQNDSWATTPAERMAHLCKTTKTRLGLVTNGEHWMLVDAPDGGIITYADWYSRLWSQEPITLQAFVALLGVGRYFCEEERKLPYLIDKSAEHQDEVTETLGEQIRRAVEVLIQALDKADLDRNRELLNDIKPPELYEAALTIMMRLVFLLSAEERDLLLLGDERYESNYAVSTLRQQLRDDAHRYSEEVLDHRYDAWSRLLSIFRAVYGGIEHETLRLPALGGSLFDPDRFPFLEGRKKGSSWQQDTAIPLPIDNRTVLFLLEAIQLYKGRTLSYRALDVEQIGYVYEGLLERTAIRAKEVTLELDATKSAKQPWVTLAELESAKLNSTKSGEDLLKERTGSAISRVRNDLKKNVEDKDADKLLSACRGDQALRDRIKPYFHLLKTDRWSYPLVYPQDAFMVATGTNRRETGTHYTPKSLTEAIVKETLEPVVYVGPAEGKPRDEWQLKLPKELLDLKVCDPAMGSGAFLVQVCRWLSERLVESWAIEEQNGKFIDTEGKVHNTGDGHEPLNIDAEERLVMAKRLIAERCLYGVDINPLAVELAKLSIWLVTLAKGRPFGFLDHNLRSGDSLLGITDLKQIMHLHIDPERGKKIHRGLFNRYKEIEQVLKLALEKRMALRESPILDIEDVRRMGLLDTEVHELLKAPELVADVVIGEALASESKQRLDEKMKVRAMEAARHIEGDLTARQMLESEAYKCLNIDRPTQVAERKPFHWALEFPEVFSSKDGGFDSIVGNPPFIGGQKITGAFGSSYREYLVERLGSGIRGSADFVVYFFLRAYSLLKYNGTFGLLAVNTISEGSSREVGLENLIKNGASIYSAYPNEAWPGKAAVITSRIHIIKNAWNGVRCINGISAKQISAYLTDREPWTPKTLATNTGKVFQGAIILGLGFTLEPEKAVVLIEKDKKYKNILFPFLIGKEVNQIFNQIPQRWVINFWDWPKIKAEEYKDAFQIVFEKVRPERLVQKDKGAKNNWWLFLRPRPELYHAIGRGQQFLGHPSSWNKDNQPMDKVIVFARGATKHLCFSMLENKSIFADSTCVIADDRYSLLSILSSDLHTIWAWEEGGRMKQDLRYTHQSVYETFPFPKDIFESNDSCMAKLGKKFSELRREYMLSNSKGMTKFYNDFHNPDLQNPSIQKCRDVQLEINSSLMAAYGWTNLQPEYGFHEVAYLPEGKNIRYTVSEASREELLYRLAMLNKERFEKEAAQGQCTTKNSAKIKSITPKVYKIPTNTERVLSKVAEPPPPQMDIFTEQSQSTTNKGNQWGSEPIDQVLAWLEAHAGWHKKQVILNGSQAEPNSWDDAISELLKDEFVEVEDDPTRYRAVI